MFQCGKINANIPELFSEFLNSSKFSYMYLYLVYRYWHNCFQQMHLQEKVKCQFISSYVWFSYVWLGLRPISWECCVCHNVTFPNVDLPAEGKKKSHSLDSPPPLNTKPATLVTAPFPLHFFAAHLTLLIKKFDAWKGKGTYYSELACICGRGG